MIGTTLNDRYRLDEKLGSGGMGTVYRAHDSTLDRDVAIKMVSSLDLDIQGQARLLQEAQAIAKLNHPNIVSVYDAGQVDGGEGSAPYIVMELVSGKTLYESPPGDLRRILAVAKQVCLIEPDGTAKLMDFGLARSVATRMTSKGEIVGTVFYLAPELALGQDFDGRADLYALGIMLYELTTGNLPFTAGDPLAVISQHIHASVVPPRAKNPEIPPVRDSLIVQLMSKDPEDRPPSAHEVYEYLERDDLLDPEAQGEKEILFLDRIVRGRFVGREQELSEARALWSEAAAGDGQTLLVSGGPARNQLFRLGIEGGAVVLALLEDRLPAQPGLGALQDQKLEQHTVVLERHAPFLIVIGNHQPAGCPIAPVHVQSPHLSCGFMSDRLI